MSKLFQELQAYRCYRSAEQPKIHFRLLTIPSGTGDTARKIGYQAQLMQETDSGTNIIKCSHRHATKEKAMQCLMGMFRRAVDRLLVSPSTPDPRTPLLPP